MPEDPKERPSIGGGASEKEELKLPQLVPAPPPSPFVARLRGEVCRSRGSDGGTGSAGGLNSSIGRRRGSERSGEQGRRVSLGEAEVIEVEEERPKSRPSVFVDLRIKGTTAKPFTLEGIDTRTIVAELKVQCQSYCSLPPEQQRLLLKGKLLQDAQTLEAAGVHKNSTMFLVKGVSAKQAAEEAAAEAERQERQRDEEEEEELRAWAAGLQQGPMCLECGVNPGRLQTGGLCGICWREMVVRENKEMKRRREEAKRWEEESARREEEERRQEEELELRRQKDTSRCYECEKKIGLTGFQCKCGYLFCAKHRYAEEHACSFDFASHGRELLAQQIKQAQQKQS